MTADAWAFGCTLYHACALKPPWTDQAHGGMLGLVRTICTAAVDLHALRSHYRAFALCSLLASLLSKAPAQRPSFKEVLALPCLQPTIDAERARPLAHTRGVRPAVYLLCACCLREMASLVLRVDVRVYTCSKTRNGCWPWPEGVTLAPPKSTWEQPHPGRSRDLKTWVLEMKPGNCAKPGFSTRFSMLRMDPKSPDSGRA